MFGVTFPNNVYHAQVLSRTLCGKQDYLTINIAETLTRKRDLFCELGVLRIGRSVVLKQSFVWQAKRSM